MEVAYKDPAELLVDDLERAVDAFRRRMADNPYPCGSRALAFAVQAGLPSRMTYNVSETARYTGVDVKTLRSENEAGRLDFIIPEGKERGARIAVEEVDRWLNEN